MNIKFLVMDVDGTLTDGKIYMGESGEMFKAFDIKDGYGIANILPQKDIVPVIITGRDSRIVTTRCAELGVIFVFQGEKDKLLCLEKLLAKYNQEHSASYSLQNVAYIGDDISDLDCMESIKKAGGVCACPADAVGRIKTVCDFISTRNGGNGAVREFIERIQS